MKVSLALIIRTLFISATATATASAGSLPECWTTNGRSVGHNPAGEEIADGQWLVNVDVQRASKEDIVWLMTKVERGNLKHVGFPIVFEPDYMVLHVQARGEGARRDALKRGANAQITEIAARGGVTAVECNGISHPQ